MKLDTAAVEALRPAVEVLREVLRGWEGDEIPAPLRRLADSSARRLPPPIVLRGLRELDSSEWLRGRVIDEAELSDDEDAFLFISRPEGWERSLAERIEAVEVSLATKRSDRVEGQLEEALQRAERMERKAKEADRLLVEARVQVAGQVEREVEAVKRERNRIDAIRSEQDRSLAAAADRIVELEAQLRSAEERIDTLRGLLERERRDSTSDPSTGPIRSWFPDDPDDMAEELDRTFSAVRRSPRARRSPRPETVGLSLPGELRPDRAEAVEWLVTMPLRWLIDGYNVAYQLEPEPDHRTRLRLVALVGDLMARAPRAATALVVFDSSLDSGGFRSWRRVSVEFAESADERIIELASTGTVAVSSDRRVREGAKSGGAVAVWSESLLEWATGTIRRE